MHTKPGGTPPVFVDRTGRRRRLSILAGTALGLGLLASLGLIAAGLFTGSSVSLPGWSDDRKPARPVEAGVEGVDGLRSSPTVSVRPSPTSTATPATPTRTATPSAPAATKVGGPRVTGTDRPGQGDERRTSKPSRSPGRPG
ncbi:hypothetical protein GA0074692_4822 [Micromonospora pallida]|uniref:Uncharacterized protein n=1 Tax=Micromonospora pallida TaxID=145854 RepID=A0A1C6T803_9ACTN|nr:hypothetical protein [Micromonospora pallida]SCL37888.1 hypothetical protein GA0074692_4822 [Micromonospora pallida]